MVRWGLGTAGPVSSRHARCQLLPPAPGWHWEKGAAVASASPWPLDTGEVLSSAFALAVFS